MKVRHRVFKGIEELSLVLLEPKEIRNIVDFKETVMIAELKDVMCKVEQLTDEDQRHIAKMLEEEIKWDSTFQNSQKELSNLAQEAVQEYHSGKTKQGDW